MYPTMVLLKQGWHLFTVAGHYFQSRQSNFVSYCWVIGLHNFLVILWNLLVQDCWSHLNASWAARNSFAGRVFVTSVLKAKQLPFDINNDNNNYYLFQTSGPFHKHNLNHTTQHKRTQKMVSHIAHYRIGVCTWPTLIGAKHFNSAPTVTTFTHTGMQWAMGKKWRPGSHNFNSKNQMNSS